MRIPTDIKNIIIDFIEQMKVHEIKMKTITQIENIDVFTISLCLYCRCVKIRGDIFNNHSLCDHYFFLSKPIYTMRNEKILKQNMFNFHCDICNIYDIFFNHLHSRNN